MAKPKASPYSIAAGAVAYAAVVSVSKHVPPSVLAAAPAVVVALVSAIERGVALVDPKLAPKVDRLAAQAEAAAKDVESVVAAIKPIA